MQTKMKDTEQNTERKKIKLKKHLKNKEGMKPREG